jgi:hypothetical protein
LQQLLDLGIIAFNLASMAAAFHMGVLYASSISQPPGFDIEPDPIVVVVDFKKKLRKRQSRKVA